MKSNPSEISKLINWIVANGGIAALGTFAVITGHLGAARLSCFISWFCGSIQFLASFNKEIVEKARAHRTPISPWISHLMDFPMIGMLVWHGWWWTAIAWVLLWLSYVNISQDELKKKEGDA